MFCLLVAVFVCATLCEAVPDSVWEAFKSTHHKSYSPREAVRRVIWERNVKLIQEHNLEYDMGLHTYTLGLNEYADWTKEEFGSFMRGYHASNRTSKATHFVPPSNVNLPDSVDWRTKGYVTPIKNQGQCGSCWAFSATGSLEGQHFKKTGKLVSLSEQNLVDCSQAEGNMGCNGGLPDYAFEYVKKNGGIDTEESYPYEAKDGKCRFDPANIGATCTGYTDIKKDSESDLQQAVATVGPISVGIDASSEKFQLYKTGVYVDNQCSSTFLDHGVLAVGYDSQNEQGYWIVKNSWGASWGNKGYIWMARNHNNMCGIATQASYPLV